MAERWGYNIGDKPVLLLWDSNENILQPGDSFFIKPKTPHAFRCTSNAKLAVMEILPDSGDPMGEFALIYRYSGDRGLSRVHTENTRWF